jgi:hypothetical protein
MISRACILAALIILCIFYIDNASGARVPELQALRTYESDAGTLMKKHGGRGTECDKRRFRRSMLKLIKEVRCCQGAALWGNPM